MEWPTGLKNAKSIERSMKNGRKVFRLMKWTESVMIIHNLIHN